MLLELEDFIQSVRLNSDDRNLNGPFLHAVRALNLKSRKLSESAYKTLLANHECLTFMNGQLSYVIEDDSIIGILQTGESGFMVRFTDIPSGLLDTHLPVFRQATH